MKRKHFQQWLAIGLCSAVMLTSCNFGIAVYGSEEDGKETAAALEQPETEEMSDIMIRLV